MTLQGGVALFALAVCGLLLPVSLAEEQDDADAVAVLRNFLSPDAVLQEQAAGSLARMGPESRARLSELLRQELTGRDSTAETAPDLLGWGASGPAPTVLAEELDRGGTWVIRWSEGRVSSGEFRRLLPEVRLKGLQVMRLSAGVAGRVRGFLSSGDGSVTVRNAHPFRWE